MLLAISIDLRLELKKNFLYLLELLGVDLTDYFEAWIDPVECGLFARILLCLIFGLRFVLLRL
jgi:hypothetical protein